MRSQQKIAKQQLKEKILQETVKARRELQEKLDDQTIRGIGCIDKKANFKGEWNPPGGGQFIDNEGKLEAWMRQKGEGAFGIHFGCAHQYFVNSKTTAEQQRQGIAAFQAKVDELNRSLGTNFRVEVDENGSAKEYLMF